MSDMDIRDSKFHLLRKHAALRTVLVTDDIGMKCKTVDQVVINIPITKGSKEFKIINLRKKIFINLKPWKTEFVKYSMSIF